MLNARERKHSQRWVFAIRFCAGLGANSSQGPTAPSLADEVQRQSRLLFAQIEHRKKNYEKRMHEESRREIEQEIDEMDDVREDYEDEQKWRAGREKRMGSWLDFAGSKRQKVGGVRVH